MIIKSATFVQSNTEHTKCPSPDKPEFAFIGRSNVGKSSLINMLTNNNKLAKTSSKPGKTQLINHFLINEAWYLVDLPGYGWAKVSKDKKAAWAVMNKDYLAQRVNLMTVFSLIDSRLPPQQVDVDFINWMGENQVPFCIIFTKTDKQSNGKNAKTVALWKNKLSENWEELPIMFVSSAETHLGKEDILNYIDEIASKTNF